MNPLENRIPPPLVMVVTAAVMWGIAQLAPAIRIDGSFRIAIAGALAMLGGLFAVLGFRAFGRAKTTVNPINIQEASSLVTSGIYHYTRNPMYLGLTGLLLAWAVYLAVPWTILGPVAFMLIITRFQVIPEERVLREKFGPAYATYKRKVRRWL
jgi:protein-S-isoprenylcysteine O-methyltransferase Ste14